MSHPRISVIVPIYNVEAFLPQCIESLIGQTYGNLDIILVDDGSPDNCPSICDKYASQTKSIKVLHKDNGGLISARKAGIQSATGDYICYVDGDDWVSQDHFANIASAIKRNNADIIVHGYTTVANTYTMKKPVGIPYGYYDRNDLVKNIIPVMLSIPPFYTFSIVPAVWGKAFKRELVTPIQLASPNDVTIGEDTTVSYPALLKADSVEVIDECGYMYRANNSSMTRTYDKKLSNNLPILARYLHQVLCLEYSEFSMEAQFRDYISYMALGAIANEIKGSSSIDSAIEKLQTIVNDPIIQSAVKTPNSPVKVRFAFNVVEKKYRLLAMLLKRYWER